MRSYKIYKLKKQYLGCKYGLDYFDPVWGQYDTLSFNTKKEAREFIKKIYN